MKRTLVRAGLALLLIGAGWVAGKAQTSGPDFELVVDAPGGRTMIHCVRGCNLKWVERGNNGSAATTATFDYTCSAERCSSGKVGGWIQK